MEDKDYKDEVQKTQVISPGNLGEQANRNKEQTVNRKTADDTALEEGLNEEKSAGDAGAFEGFENTKR